MTDAELESSPLTLLTVTWSADLEHFALLRESLMRSALADCPHTVIVQTEDLPLFQHFSTPGLTLRPTAEVLPTDVEARRRQARRQQSRWGRRGTILAGSLARRMGWPHWPRYTGWHTQQLCKLAAATSCDARTVAVLDSDVIVTPHARIEDFESPQPKSVYCLQQWQSADRASRKVRHWQHSTSKLLELPEHNDEQVDAYYDTPFIFDVAALRAMLAWLESRHRQPWWRSLLDCPPRQWSEFDLYRSWLRHYYPGEVTWRGTDFIGYLYDASNPERLAVAFRNLVHGQRCHYVTIHSQSSGRQNWGPKDYADTVLKLLAERENL